MSCWHVYKLFIACSLMAHAVPGTKVSGTRSLQSQGEGLAAIRKKALSCINHGIIKIPAPLAVTGVGFPEKVRYERDSIYGLQGCRVRGLSG